MFLQILQILRFILSQRRNNFLVLQQRQNLLTLLLQFMQRRENLFPLIDEFLWNVIGVMNLLPQARGIIHHICRLHEVVLCLRQVLGWVHIFLGEEFEQRENEMSVQEGDELLGEIIFLSLHTISTLIFAWRGRDTSSPADVDADIESVWTGVSSVEGAAMTDAWMCEWAMRRKLRPTFSRTMQISILTRRFVPRGRLRRRSFQRG